MKDDLNIIFFDRLFVNNSNLKPGIFIDRDGVIIKDVNYLSNINQVEFEIGALNFLKSLYKSNWKIVIITNQSGVGRGYFSWEDYKLVTNRMIEMIGESNPIKAIYASGEDPNRGEGYWRKPSPEMIFKASKDLNINLKSSFFIGDRLTDMYAGLYSGVKGLIHLKTGYGYAERDAIKKLVDNKGKFNKDGFSSDILFKDNLSQIENSFWKRSND